MNGEMLNVDCAEWRDVAEISPAEMEVIAEMMIAAGEKLCQDQTA